VFLDNADAETVLITADHGNALGEWGLYGHAGGMPTSAMRDVPLVETTASDSGTYEPEVEPETTSEESLKEKLRDLGYV
jgi:hypothetical protein